MRQRAIRYAVIGIAVILTAAACTSDVLAPGSNAIHPSADFYIGYSHVLANGGDVLAWVNDINADCSDSVDATIAAGAFTIPMAPELPPGNGNLVIQHTCSGASTARSVHIHGAGPGQTVLTQLNTTYGGYDVPLDGFLVYDNNVFFRDVTIQSDAQHPDLKLYGGAGVRFDNVAGGGVKNSVFIGMQIGGVDTYESSGIVMDSVSVQCNAGSVTPVYAMGLMIRESNYVTITHSNVRNCPYESYYLDIGQHNEISFNTASCDNGFHCRNGVAIIGRDEGCVDRPASYNYVHDNTLNGYNYYRPVIEIYGGGSTQYNTIEQNGINGADHHGIWLDSYHVEGPADSPSDCGGAYKAYDLHGSNYLHNNSISNTGRLAFNDTTGEGGVGIWVGSNSNNMVGNWITGANDSGLNIDFGTTGNSFINGRIWSSTWDGAYVAGAHATVQNNDISYNGHWGVCLNVQSGSGNSPQSNSYTGNIFGPSTTSTSTSPPLTCE